MAVKIIPLSDKIGAEIRGIDLSQPVDTSTTDLLVKAFHKYILLLFRGQKFSDEKSLVESADWLGNKAEITMPGNKFGEDGTSIHLISNIRDENGTAIGDLGDSELWYHHDNSFTEAPDKATYLYAVELPRKGGNTLFSNCYCAYDELPGHLRKAIAGKRVLQVYDYGVCERPSKDNLENTPHYWQPAIVVHPVTGKKALYFDRLMTAAIEGYDETESEELLQELFPYIERIDYELSWRVGDYIIFDNRCSAHARREFPEKERRLLKRGKVLGEPMVHF